MQLPHRRRAELKRRAKLDAASATALGLWAAGLSVDYLIARANLQRPPDDQLRLITEWGQDNPALSVAPLIYLVLHVTQVLPWWLDAFHWAGKGFNKLHKVTEVTQLVRT